MRYVELIKEGKVGTTAITVNEVDFILLEFGVNDRGAGFAKMLRKVRCGVRSCGWDGWVLEDGSRFHIVSNTFFKSEVIFLCVFVKGAHLKMMAAATVWPWDCDFFSSVSDIVILRYEGA